MIRELYLNLFGKQKGTITDDSGNTYTVDQAKTITETTPYRCNGSFCRLVENNFDLQKTLDYYDD